MIRSRNYFRCEANHAISYASGKGPPEMRFECKHIAGSLRARAFVYRLVLLESEHYMIVREKKKQFPDTGGDFSRGRIARAFTEQLF